jgi:hypothetical protein
MNDDLPLFEGHDLPLTAWHLAHEIREMANAGFGDLRCAIDPTFSAWPDERSAREKIKEGFGLISSGHPVPRADVEPYETAMLAASDMTDPQEREQAMRAALADLFVSLGMTPD